MQSQPLEVQNLMQSNKSEVINLSGQTPLPGQVCSHIYLLGHQQKMLQQDIDHECFRTWCVKLFIGHLCDSNQFVQRLEMFVPARLLVRTAIDGNHEMIAFGLLNAVYHSTISSAGATTGMS